MVYEVTDQNFQQEVLESPIPCVLDFQAGWCESCVNVTPAIEELSAEYDGRVKFCTVNIDANRALRIKFAVAVIPFIVWVHDGMRCALFDESVPAAKLRERIDYMLAGGEAPRFPL